jgi:prevent-host-death family protein
MTIVVILVTAMKQVQMKDAKARLSALVDQAVDGQPSLITRHGKPEAVVLGFAEWERLSKVPSFGRLLMSAPDGVEAVPKRRASRMRPTRL